MQGWECPRCHKTYAPWVRSCNERHAMSSVTVYGTVTCTCEATNATCPVHAVVFSRPSTWVT